MKSVKKDTIYYNRYTGAVQKAPVFFDFNNLQTEFKHLKNNERL